MLDEDATGSHLDAYDLPTQVLHTLFAKVGQPTRVDQFGAFVRHACNDQLSHQELLDVEGGPIVVGIGCHHAIGEALVANDVRNFEGLGLVALAKWLTNLFEEILILPWFETATHVVLHLGDDVVLPIAQHLVFILGYDGFRQTSDVATGCQDDTLEGFLKGFNLTQFNILFLCGGRHHELTSGTVELWVEESLREGRLSVDEAFPLLTEIEFIMLVILVELTSP